ncbi:MAG: hypothetical protein GF365_03020 [Candidatus Buchananbacteria bacterium]|nr:hypothetical protein [Candidatus Buchananbacteria bacterium]
MDFEKPRAQEQKQAVYTTEKSSVSWAEGTQVWVVVEKQPDNAYVVRAEFDDPQKSIEDWLDILPTSQANVESKEEAKRIADQMMVDREKWPTDMS